MAPNPSANDFALNFISGFLGGKVDKLNYHGVLNQLLTVLRWRVAGRLEVAAPTGGRMEELLPGARTLMRLRRFLLPSGLPKYFLGVH
jgi:hypothetical protein